MTRSPSALAHGRHTCAPRAGAATTGRREGQRILALGVVAVLVVLVAALMWVISRDPQAHADPAPALVLPAENMPRPDPAPRGVPHTVTSSPAQSTRRPPSTALLGRWTPQLGAEVARRALTWLGWPYAFDGGDGSGPTRGRAVDYDSRNDGQRVGFDCSGLVLYALSPWTLLDHLAADQYSEAGSFHPALNALEPGDLIFWSRDGTVAGIGHVAVYIGDGEVVQAPRSGAVITTTPLYQVEAGYMGATRPLT